MRTLAILSSKGGTGKTTVALHLAAAAASSGRKVLVADLDPQRSACDWRRDRRSAKPGVIETRPGCLFVAHQAASREGADLMILDTPPSAGEEVNQAMRLADLCLIVIRPSVLDLRAISRTVDEVKRLNRRALFVVNQAPPRRRGREPAIIDRTVETLRAYGLPIATAGLRSRVVFQSSLAAGLTAGEVDAKGPAAAEVRALWRLVSKELWKPVSQAVAPTRLRVVPQMPMRPAAVEGLRPAS